jgi:hypothetical protein
MVRNLRRTWTFPPTGNELARNLHWVIKDDETFDPVYIKIKMILHFVSQVLKVLMGPTILLLKILKEWSYDSQNPIRILSTQ